MGVGVCLAMAMVCCAFAVPAGAAEPLDTVSSAAPASSSPAPASPAATEAPQTPAEPVAVESPAQESPTATLIEQPSEDDSNGGAEVGTALATGDPLSAQETSPDSTVEQTGTDRVNIASAAAQQPAALNEQADSNVASALGPVAEPPEQNLAVANPNPTDIASALPPGDAGPNLGPSGVSDSFQQSIRVNSSAPRVPAIGGAYSKVAAGLGSEPGPGSAPVSSPDPTPVGAIPIPPILDGPSAPHFAGGPAAVMLDMPSSAGASPVFLGFPPATVSPDLSSTGPAPAAPISPDPIPSPGNGSSSAAVGPSSDGFFFGFAALLLGLLVLAGQALSRRLRSAPVCWRPVPFVSLLERPG